ncbi:UNVERIFIED_CONTAM: hypothetical protein Sradi_4424400 [Sesamum radiatum]|uniref:Reverse transcriptase zinc-binding domain-containing protein n=1 Tax=Sesamum radiatum TaxID=300843 RepID=A0AAW2NRT3_SESRA
MPIVSSVFPLQGADSNDEMVWHIEKNGPFTVCGAYQVTCDMMEEGTCSPLGQSWEFIWRLKALQKVVLFAWRCAWNALPTNVNLQRRGIAVNEGCGGCMSEKEDAMRVLLFCNFARLVWVWPYLECSELQFLLCRDMFRGRARPQCLGFLP